MNMCETVCLCVLVIEVIRPEWVISDWTVKDWLIETVAGYGVKKIVVGDGGWNFFSWAMVGSFRGRWLFFVGDGGCFVRLDRRFVRLGVRFVRLGARFHAVFSCFCAAPGLKTLRGQLIHRDSQKSLPFPFFPPFLFFSLPFPLFPSFSPFLPIIRLWLCIRYAPWVGRLFQVHDVWPSPTVGFLVVYERESLTWWLFYFFHQVNFTHTQTHRTHHRPRDIQVFFFHSHS